MKAYTAAPDIRNIIMPTAAVAAYCFPLLRHPATTQRCRGPTYSDIDVFRLLLTCMSLPG